MKIEELVKMISEKAGIPEDKAKLAADAAVEYFKKQSEGGIMDKIGDFAEGAKDKLEDFAEGAKDTLGNFAKSAGSFFGIGGKKEEDEKKEEDKKEEEKK
jgi:hypothetical protein